MKIGICGLGRFGTCFVPLFQAHPLVDEVVLADSVSDRVDKLAEDYDICHTCDSLGALCHSDVDAIALFTQRHLHGPHTLAALEAGKHVCSAVPIALELDEITAIVERVTASGLIYMTLETSVYHPATVYCQRRFSAGDFGTFVYGQAQYLHDMDFFYDSYRSSGGPNWKRVAGLPPMFYPTHSLAMLLAVTGATVTEVSCFGYEDRHPDEIFRRGNNEWDNPFSNEHGLMRTSDGGVIRISEMRRVGWHWPDCVYMSLFGTEGSFESNPLGSCWMDKTGSPVDVSAELRCPSRVGHDHLEPQAEETPLQADEYTGISAVHDVKRLPEQFKGLPNGHFGSHQFLADDFVKACVDGTQPFCDVGKAASFMAPGLIAHASAQRGGEVMQVPQFGREQ